MERLETERLILRDWRNSDADDMFEYAADDRVGPMAGWVPHKSVEDSRQIIDMFVDDDDVYAIVWKKENKVIGGIGIHARKPSDDLKDLEQREIGYVLNPSYWGRGIIPEAVEEVKRFSFEEMKLDLLWCAHFDFNDKSKRVIEKTGFEYRFTKAEQLKNFDMKNVNTLYYVITKEDYFR